MLYAKVVLGLPIEGPFDYIIPQELRAKISPGSRVSIPFGNSKKIGYVVALNNKSTVANLKSITSVLDNQPILDSKMLLLTHKLAEYYCSSWGMMIEAAIPANLRKPKPVEFNPLEEKSKISHKGIITLYNFEDDKKKWEIYLAKIKECLGRGQQTLLVLADIPEVFIAEKIILQRLGIEPVVLIRNEAQELKKWLQVKTQGTNICLGTRSSIFAPLNNLGLIIVDEEQAYSYKQDQAPHYHLRQASLMRAKIEEADLILGSSAPSLEAINLVKNNLATYNIIHSERVYPEIKIIDMKGLPLLSQKRQVILAHFLQDAITKALGDKLKILIFLNRIGFATMSSCSSCGQVLKCPRCNISLVYHFKEGILACRYCNYKIQAPKICPSCNAGYIRFSGAGTEKIESEITRLFPQARITQNSAEGDVNLENADIFIASQAILNRKDLNFDLSVVLGIDNSLNHIDFRASEKAYGILKELSNITKKRLIIQTGIPNHLIFKAIAGNNPDLFYHQELKERRQLHFPPLRHHALVKIRSAKEERAEKIGQDIFEKLKSSADKNIEVVSLFKPHPEKLRGNFLRQILVSAKSAEKISKFLKINLKKIRHSGIILTVDVDPI